MTSRWESWGTHVAKHAWKYAIGVTAFLLLLTSPVLDLQLGFPDAGTQLSSARTSRRTRRCANRSAYYSSKPDASTYASANSGAHQRTGTHSNPRAGINSDAKCHTGSGSRHADSPTDTNATSANCAFHWSCYAEPDAGTHFDRQRAATA